MISHGELIIGTGMEEFGSVGVLALDTKENIERGGASTRYPSVRVSGLSLHCGKYDGSISQERNKSYFSCAEFLAGQRMVAAKKVGGGSPLLALQLQFEQFECRAVATADKKMC